MRTFALLICGLGLGPAWASSVALQKCTPALTFVRTAPISFARNIDAYDQASLRDMIRESQPIFDQGIQRVGVVIEGISFWIIRGESNYRVMIDDETAPRPDVYRVRSNISAGGLSSLIFVTKKNLKRAGERFSVTSLNQAIAVRLENGNAGGPAFFAIYRDEVKSKWEVLRKVIDLTYARPYILSADTRARNGSSKGVKLVDLDYAFAMRGNAPDQPDLYLTLKGGVIERPAPDPTKPKLEGTFAWFLSQDQEGAPLRVVVFKRVGAKLPEIVTAYYPNDQELAVLKANLR